VRCSKPFENFSIKGNLVKYIHKKIVDCLGIMILERWDGVMWTGLVWLRIGTGGELL
jgi:hypothetical protein